MDTAIKHPVPDRVERQSTRMSKITNDDLTRSGTGCFTAVAICRGVNLVGNLGGRWQTAFGSKLLTRKTGRVETSDTVEDKNKNVYIITGQLKLKHICAIFGGHDVLPSTRSIFFFWGHVPPVPRGIYAPAHMATVGVGVACFTMAYGYSYMSSRMTSACWLLQPLNDWYILCLDRVSLLFSLIRY